MGFICDTDLLAPTCTIPSFPFYFTSLIDCTAVKSFIQEERLMFYLLSHATRAFSMGYKSYSFSFNILILITLEFNKINLNCLKKNCTHRSYYLCKDKIRISYTFCIGGARIKKISFPGRTQNAHN